MSRIPTALHLLRDLLLLIIEGEEVEARSVNIDSEEKKVGLKERPQKDARSWGRRQNNQNSTYQPYFPLQCRGWYGVKGIAIS